MRYLLDTNTLSGKTLERIKRGQDVSVLSEVVQECSMSDSTSRIILAGITIIEIEAKHLRKMKEVLAVNGGNTRLISLYDGKGTADVVLISYILSERDDPDTLFTEDYTLVTQDKPLIEVAASYGIKTVPSLPAE